MPAEATPLARRKRVLVAYAAGGTHVQTTLDYLNSLSRYLNAEVHFVHVTNDAIMDFDMNAYDIVFNNYCARWPFDNFISTSFAEALAAFRGPKFLGVQDEYDRTDKLKAAILDYGFNVVLTCIPQDQVERVYPRSEFGHVQFVTVLTGYVPEDIETLAQYALPLRERKTLIGYRGRDIGGNYGRLAFDKLEIGRRMRAICEARGLPVDIDWTEESRIYGTGWFKFLGNCRATLGAESGSNVFDFDGAIAERFAAETARLGHPPTYEEFLPSVEAKDAEMDIGQISPRVFEAAALRTPMVLFTGRYSDIIAPDEHYIELKKNFSNVDDVLRRLEDIPALEAMTERAYRALIASGAYNYPTFVSMIDRLMDAKLEEPASAYRPRALGRQAQPPVRVMEQDEVRMLEERPTEAPMPSLAFHLKIARREGLIYQAEIRRLNRVYQAEIQRLHALIHAAPSFALARAIGNIPVIGPAARKARNLLRAWRGKSQR